MCVCVFVCVRCMRVCVAHVFVSCLCVGGGWVGGCACVCVCVCMCMCMCVCVCVCVCVYVHACVWCVHAHMHVCVHAHVCVCVHA